MSSDQTARVQTPSEGADSRVQRVARAARGWQRHLAELGGPNALLWYEDLSAGALDLTTAHPNGVSMLLAGRPTRLSDLVREPAALDGARRRARGLRARATELSEERGLEVGFIAIGMANWHAPRLPRVPRAPVLLRSCVLRPTDATERDFDLDLGSDVEFNHVLAHYLRSEQGIEVDAEALADMSTVTSGFDPYPVYAALARACVSVPGFSVLPRLVVGTFSHSKLSMVADLAAQSATLAEHDVVASMAGDLPAREAVRRPARPASPAPGAARPGLVLDADASQRGVVDAVLGGSHLMVVGAPGTGKTQTIANLIPALAADGKRVLFVAEKRAALEAVLGRLEGVGLADLVFHAQGAAVDRGRVARAFAPAPENDQATQSPDDGAERDRLAHLRDELSEHVSTLHDVREPWGVSVHELQWAMAGFASRRPAPASRVRLPEETMRRLSRARVDDLAHQLTAVAALGAWAPAGGEDPWYGARIRTDEEAARAREIVTELSGGGLEQLTKTLDGILEESSVPPARSVTDWESAMTTMTGVRDTLEVFRPEVFDIPLDEHVAATASRAWRSEHAVSLGWWSRLRARGQAKRMLRPGRPPADLHAELVTARRQRTAWYALVGAGGRPEISPRLDEAQAAFDGFRDDLRWLGERLATTGPGGALTGIPLPVLAVRLAELAARPERLSVLPHVGEALEQLRAPGLGELVDDLARRGVPATHVAAELESVWWASLAREITASDARYGGHDGARLRRTVADYVATDVAHRAAEPARVRAALHRAVRHNARAHRQQVTLLRTEAAKSRHHLPLRELLPQALETVTLLKPCWAMSPLAVAQLVPPGQWFDVVIIDEASLVAPAEALSAISRARQVVIFGDARQSPPSGFATSVLDESSPVPGGTEGGEPAPDSIVDVLLDVLPTRTLAWHYRSRDERLFGFANRTAYGGALVTFPGAVAASPVRLVQVDGLATVVPGRDAAIESTDAEVDRVVALVLDHLRARPAESLCVVTLNTAHARRIGSRLRAALAEPDARDLLGLVQREGAEPFFVKSMERVQGEERDAVIVSVGYGKTPHGRVLHRFGILGTAGGERPLTVAVTRARQRMTVVSALTAADLDPSRLRTAGETMLRDFLEYAENGAPAWNAEERSSAASDPLMADLADRLRTEGLTVLEQYGSGPHRVDLAVGDPSVPGRLLVAVEGDGTMYAGLAGPLERDRLRVEQLERLGWHHLRVWSTDLYRDPAREVARVLKAVRVAAAARTLLAAGPRAGPAADVGGPRAEGRPADARSGPLGDRGDESGDPSGDRGDVPSDVRGDVPSDDSQKPGKKRRRVFRRRPEQTSDDTNAGWGERPDADAHDDWLLEQRPPHWE